MRWVGASSTLLVKLISFLKGKRTLKNSLQCPARPSIILMTSSYRLKSVGSGEFSLLKLTYRNGTELSSLPGTPSGLLVRGARPPAPGRASAGEAQPGHDVVDAHEKHSQQDHPEDVAHFSPAPFSSFLAFFFPFFLPASLSLSSSKSTNSRTAIADWSFTLFLVGTNLR